jgi:membrane-associated protein
MHAIVDAIQSLPPVVAYAIIAALVFGEAAMFVGFIFPGETAVLLGGFLASTGQLNIWVLCTLVVVAAVAGDTVGYEVGKLFGPRVMSIGLFTRHQVRVDSGQRMLRERGGPAVFLGRFTAFLRAVMPGLAGLSNMRYRKFLFWNALGGAVWGIGFTLVGYFAGASYEQASATIGRGSAIVLSAIVVGLVVAWQIRRHRAAHSTKAGH